MWQTTHYFFSCYQTRSNVRCTVVMVTSGRNWVSDVHGPYDWNQFPLAPPGCKAVIYKSPAQRGSWGSRGVDAWYLGPSLDHYRCCHYFVPETCAYRISGSAELFPQHCQVPCLTTSKHLQVLTTEVVDTLSRLTPMKQQQVLTLLKAKLVAQQDTPPFGIPSHEPAARMAPARQ